MEIATKVIIKMVGQLDMGNIIGKTVLFTKGSSRMA
jgi:hypothetical protein